MGASLLERAVVGAAKKLFHGDMRAAAEYVERQLDGLSWSPDGSDGPRLTGMHLVAQDWRSIARPEQLAPEGDDWDTWFVRAGRGFGKTRLGAEWVHEQIAEGRRSVALGGPTAADVRDVMVLGRSGLLSTARPGFRPLYEPSKRRVVWPNGAIGTLFSGEEPTRFRGPQHEVAWLDELPHWKYARESWDMLQFGLRLGPHPRACVTSTPRAIPLVKEILDDPRTVATRGSTYDNRRNLAPKYLARIHRLFDGTRLGRQEIYGDILDDNPNALWKLSDIERRRMTFAKYQAARVELKRVLVSVDPAVSTNEDSDETGIIVVGKGMCHCEGVTPQMHGFVFDDKTGIYTPGEWATKVAETYAEHKADRIVAERNQGGDLIEANLRAAGTHLPIETVHVKEGKRLRAEPCAALYEGKGIVHHVGGLGALEDQMTQWNPGSDDSPDRIDALVQGLTKLFLEEDEKVSMWDVL